MATLEKEGDVNTYFRNIMAESERGKVILLAAKIDELLGELLKRYFKPTCSKNEKEDKVFRDMGISDVGLKLSDVGFAKHPSGHQ